jgi:hypothetical protein
VRDDKKKAADGSYSKIKDSALTGAGTSLYDHQRTSAGPLPDTARDQEANSQQPDLYPGTPKQDDKILEVIRMLNLGAKLDEVAAQAAVYNYSGLKKITDDKKDSFEMYFDVKTDEAAKEKYHDMYFKLKSPLAPWEHKLASSVFSEAQEKKIDDGLERVYKVFRGEVDGVFYVVIYALYKQIMFFNKKDLLVIRAFKKLDNGDVVEISMSMEHPEFPEAPKTDRMKLVRSMEYITKSDTGSNIVMATQLFPRVGTGFMILKPVYTSMFRKMFKNMDEQLQAVKADEAQLLKEFADFRRIPY